MSVTTRVTADWDLAPASLDGWNYDAHLAYRAAGGYDLDEIEARRQAKEDSA